MASRDSTQPGASRPTTRSSAKHTTPEEPANAAKRRRRQFSAAPVADQVSAEAPQRATEASHPPAATTASSTLSRFRERLRAGLRRNRRAMARRSIDPDLSSAEDDDGSADAPTESPDASSLHALLARLHGAEGARGLFSMGASSGRFGALLEGMRSGEDALIEGALNDLAQALLLGSEESLQGFRPEHFVSTLQELVNVEHNPQLAILACRCLTNMLDALPNSSSAVATCIPTLCSKLLCIEYIDLAEQCLTTISKLAAEQGPALLQAGGLNAVLAYMDFFPTHLQRDAVAAAAAICKSVTRESLPLVRDSLAPLCMLLQGDKDKSMRESACVAIERIVVGLRTNPAALTSVASTGVIPPLLFLLSSASSRDRLFGSTVRVLGTLVRYHAPVQRELFEHHIVATLANVLKNEAASPTDQLGDVITLLTELFPALPADMFYVQLGASKALGCGEPAWEWQNDDGAWLPYGPRDVTRLEAAFQAGVPSTTLLISGQPYVARLDNMTQTNRLTGNSRRLRRTEDREPVAATSAPDERGAFLEAHPQYLEAVCHMILPLLFDVINSCGSIAIRRRVLDALLRLLATAPAPLLVESLRSISVSSLLAQLLSSIDGRTAAAALQMVQLLAQKLPDVFQVFFRRKGVLFGVTKLAHAEPQAKPLAPASDSRSRRRRSGNAEAGEAASTDLSRDEEMRTSLATHARTILRETFRLVEGAADPLADPHAAMGELRALNALAHRLQTDPAGAIASLAEIFGNPERAPSSFEVQKSELDGALLRLLTEADFGGVDRIARATMFTLSFGKTAGSLEALVLAVQEQLAGLPAFAVNESRDRRRDLSVLSAPIKLRLERDPSESGLREWGQSVMIEPLAPIQAIEDFLLSRVRVQGSSSGSLRRPRSRGGRGDEASEEDHMLARSPSMPDTDDVNRSTDVVEVRPVGEDAAEQQAAGRPRLTLTMNGHILPSGMSIYAASAAFSPVSAAAAAAATDSSDGGVMGSDLLSALSATACTIQFRLWRPEDDPHAHGSLRTMSADPAAKKDLSMFDMALLSPSLPLPADDPAVTPLKLLRALHAVATRHQYLQLPTDASLAFPAPTAFVNSNVASKVLQQVTDFDSLCQGSVAPICRAVMAACPFLCPFEARLRYLHFTAFGPVRALQRYKLETGSVEDESRDRRRMTRTKVRLSRERILESAAHVFATHAESPSLLEFEFSNEHGTGLGPTLEFYTLASRELQRSSLGLWRPSEGTGEYVFHREGLYPMPRLQPAPAVLKHFDTLGRLMGRALLDGRQVDITLSNAFYAWLLGEDRNLGFEELQVIDGGLHASLLPLRKLWQQFTAAPAGTADLKLDGVAIEDLSLTFTLPGYPEIELQKGGADTVVTLPRLGEYIDRVVAMTVREGVQAQMQAFLAGFSAVMSPEKVALFAAAELDRVFCGLRYHPWDAAELAAACRAEHGFTGESEVVRWLFEMLAEFGPEDQRSFVSFVTGCPNLPIGGFRGLRPPLTVVPKSRGAEAARDLPSVMTCQNYLKLPEYSSRAQLAERLLLAMREGQGSFLLS